MDNNNMLYVSNVRFYTLFHLSYVKKVILLGIFFVNTF